MEHYQHLRQKRPTAEVIDEINIRTALRHLGFYEDGNLFKRPDKEKAVTDYIVLSEEGTYAVFVPSAESEKFEGLVRKKLLREPPINSNGENYAGAALGLLSGGLFSKLADMDPGEMGLAVAVSMAAGIALQSAYEIAFRPNDPETINRRLNDIVGEQTSFSPNKYDMNLVKIFLGSRTTANLEKAICNYN